MKKTINQLIELLGFLMLFYGISRIYLPAAFIVIGLWLIVVALIEDLPQKKVDK